VAGSARALRRRLWGALHAACAGILVAACATNPVTGRRELVLMSPEREASLGREAASQVETSIGLVGAQPLADYVSALGQRLAAHSPRRGLAYRFLVADMPEANAFALPGGWIYVSRGLLAIANSEAELANVIGHEIGHVAARHAAQRETRALGVGLLSVLGTIAAGVAGGAQAAQAVGSLGQVAGAGLIASYSRDQERQADEIGQELATRAGYDPGAMASFLTTLERESKLHGGERLPSFLDSHPVTAERVRDTAARARALAPVPAPALAATRGDFLAKLEGLLVGPDPKQGVFRDARFLHPGLEFALDFPPGWKTQNQPSAVSAAPPEGGALVVLELQGEGPDPREAARRFAEANRLRFADARETRIGGFPAYRALAQLAAQGQTLAVDLTWIAHPRGTFRIAGAAPPARFERFQPSFVATARSFRSLDPEERASLHELHLAIVPARGGETLAALSERSGNRWSVEETAVSNALAPGARLPEGELVKIARAMPLGD
jgi:predicted Zn-dependent protease